MAEPIQIFLDQNHWIYLAKSYWGKPHKDSHAAVSDEMLAMVLQDEVRLPLNLIHLIEHLRHERQDSRERLAEVFENFSRGWFFAAWDDIIPLEINRALWQTFMPNEAFESFEVFGRGHLFGVGPRGREAWPSDWTDDEIEMLRRVTSQPGQLYGLLTFPNESGRGRQKTSIIGLSERNAAAAEDLRSVRRPYQNEVHRRAQYAGYTLDLQSHLKSALKVLGKSFDDFVALGVEGLSAFWQRVPSLDVDCELTLYRDRQHSKAVDKNDVWDIGHLALAVPYCSAIVVERFWARAIEETGLAEKYGIAVFTDLSDLLEWRGQQRKPFCLTKACT